MSEFVTTADRIAAAAVGSMPRPRHAVCAWTGEETAEFFAAMNMLERPYLFWCADEPTQRTFLLLVAEYLRQS